MECRTYPGRVARAASTTALGTTNTNINGLTLTLGVGTWNIDGALAVVPVGAPTETDFLFAAGGGLAVSYVGVSLFRWVAAGTTTTSTINALASATGASVASVTGARLSGTIIVSTAGTLTLQGIRVAGTSATVQIGAYLSAMRV